MAKLQLEYPCDLLIVDNSPGPEYVERVKDCCTKCGIKNYKVEHLEISKEIPRELRIEMGQERIREEIISGGYDAWFSWESDIIIQANALNELVKMSQAGVMMVIHNYWMRVEPTSIDNDIGIALVRKECFDLEENWFSLKDGPDAVIGDPDFWQKYEAGSLKDRLFDGGGNYIEVYGLIDPVYHLHE